MTLFSTNAPGNSSECIYIIDANVPLHIKTEGSIPLYLKWDLLKEMYDMTVRGTLIFPEQVRQELTDVEHPDAPGTWVAGAWKRIDKELAAPAPESIRQVIRDFPEISQDEESDKADPYVVALALTLGKSGYSPTVASGDGKVTEACQQYNIPTVSPPEFIEIVLRPSSVTDENQTITIQPSPPALLPPTPVPSDLMAWERSLRLQSDNETTQPLPNLSGNPPRVSTILSTNLEILSNTPHRTRIEHTCYTVL